MIHGETTRGGALVTRTVFVPRQNLFQRWLALGGFSGTLTRPRRAAATVPPQIGDGGENRPERHGAGHRSVGEALRSRREIGPIAKPAAGRAIPLQAIGAALLLLLATSLAPGVARAADDQPSEESMAAYADAANFQTAGATDLAIEAWQEFLEKYPDHPRAAEAAHYLGVCYMQRENPDYLAAAKAFADALEDEQYDLREESLINRGWCLYAAAGDGPERNKELLKESFETFAKLRDESPGSRFLDRALFYSGEISYELDQPQQAISFYDKLLESRTAEDSPLRCDALYARGVAQEDIQRFDDAVASYRDLLERCPDDELTGDVHLRLGDLMIRRGQYGEALASFDEAIESLDNPEDRAYALFRQGYALVQADKPAEAAAKYEQLLAEYPDSQYAASAVLASAQSTYRSGNLEAAARRFEKVLQQNNPAAATEAAHWLAQIELTQGDFEAAARIAREQLNANPQGEFAMALRLDLAEALSHNPETLEESLQQFADAYRDRPDDPLASRALYNAAFLSLQSGQLDRALQLADEFLNRFPDDTLAADVQFVAAEALLSSGRAEPAAERYGKLLSSAADRDEPQRGLWLLRAAAANNAAGRPDETIKLLSDQIGSLSDPAQQAEARFLIGQAHLRAGRATQAAEAFQASSEAEWPRAAEAALMAGQALLGSGEPQQARQRWQQLIERTPESPMAAQARYKLAQLASDNEDHAQAIAQYDAILESKSDPGLLPYALYGKGWSLVQSGQEEPAAQILTRVIEENPDHPLRDDALLARGISRRTLGQLDGAQRDLETFLETEPQGTNLGHALYELALIDQQQGEPARAAKRLERLVEQVPSYPSMDKVLYELGWSLRESGQEQAAMQQFGKLLKQYPENALAAEAAYFVGQQYYRDDQWEQAAKYFAIAAERSQDADLSEKAHYRLGWSRFKLGQYDAAEKAFQQQAQRHGDGELGIDALMMVGECRFKQGQHEQAIDAFARARQRIRDRDESADTLRGRQERQVRELVLLHGGQSAAQLNRWDEAVDWYDELRERFPATSYLPQVFYETGFAYQQQGELDQALKFFSQVADNYRNELAARARFMMGEIHFQRGEPDKAIPEYQRVMFGFGAENAPPAIQNWQAKSGFEAGRCAELLLERAKTDAARRKARQFAVDFFEYVTEKHPEHELAAQSRQRLEALKQS